MVDEEERSLTTGSVPKKIAALAFPIFLSNLFQQLYNAVDSLIVGQFIGRQALAAVSSSSSLIYLLVGFINGVAIGAGVLVARYYGAKDQKRLEQAVHTTIALGLAAGVVLTVAGVILTPQILRWMGTPDDVIGNSILYFRVYFLGSSAVVLYNMEASILQSVGDSRSPMVYLILASLTNVVLDLLFVAVFRRGVGSAALATIISQALSAYLAFRKLTRTREGYRLNWRKIAFTGPILRQVVTLGIPSGVQNSVISLANVIVQSNINSFGSVAMAGCGAYSKVEGFAFLPVTCFSLSLSTFVSQNVGARRFARVDKVVAQCMIKANARLTEPPEQWVLIRRSVRDASEANLGWVPLECVTEYTAENMRSITFPLKVSSGEASWGSVSVSAPVAADAGDVEISYHSGGTATVPARDILYPTPGAPGWFD